MHAVSIVTSILFALTLGACQKESQPASGEAPAPSVADKVADNAAPTPPAAAPAGAPPQRAAANQGSAALKLTGAVTKDLEGPIVRCGFTRLKGRDQGRTWAIRSEELDFQVLATTDEELTSPTVVLNVHKPARAIYAFRKQAGTATGTDGTVAEIDADLHGILGDKVVHVKGSMTCPPR